MSIRIVPQGPPRFDWLQPTPRVIEPELRDMTPAQIYAKHGEDVARYITDLRGQVEMWQRLFNARATVQQSPAQEGT